MKRVLITGGTGSFGGTAVRKLLADPAIERVVVFSRDEKKQHDMRHEIIDPRLDYIIGDVRDRESVQDAFRDIDVVFHAAALKHVPTGEYFPMEMVRTNILGTQNVIAAAEQSGSVKKVVLLSTDKAVYPINVLGITKAMAEKLLVARSRAYKNPVFCSVRYGNVMASRGSVIPLFIDQILKGEVLTVTDPEMTRLMLTLDDAITLVLLAIDKGEQGDLFIKKSPATSIGTIAEALIEIFETTSKIQVIGSRAGEKKHETLATAMEIARAEDLGDFYRIKSDSEYDYEQFYEKGDTREFSQDLTSDNSRQLSLEETKEMLLSLDYVQKALKQRV